MKKQASKTSKNVKSGKAEKSSNGKGGKGKNHPVYSPKVTDFITVAMEYTNMVENAEQYTKKEFIDRSMKIINLLYLKGLLLPELDKVFETGSEHFVVEQQWNEVKRMIAHKLGTHETFVKIYEPIMNDSEDAEDVSLSECFADIYQDTKNIVSNFKVGTIDTMNDSVWECKMNFERYWGPRALSLLSVLHSIYFSADTLEDEPSKGFKKKELDLDSIDTSSWFLSQRMGEFGVEDDFADFDQPGEMYDEDDIYDDDDEFGGSISEGDNYYDEEDWR